MFVCPSGRWTYAQPKFCERRKERKKTEEAKRKKERKRKKRKRVIRALSFVAADPPAPSPVEQTFARPMISVV